MRITGQPSNAVFDEVAFRVRYIDETEEKLQLLKQHLEKGE